MEKNLIVRLNLKSGKNIEVEIPSYKEGELEKLLEDVTMFNEPTFLKANDTLFVRWVEIEFVEDVSYLEFSEAKTHEGMSVVLDDVKLVEAKVGEWAEGEGLMHKGERVITKDKTP